MKPGEGSREVLNTLLSRIEVLHNRSEKLETALRAIKKHQEIVCGNFGDESAEILRYSGIRKIVNEALGDEGEKP